MNACVGLEIENESLIIQTEIDDGIQISKCNKNIIIAGQKGLVEEKDLVYLLWEELWRQGLKL